MKQPAHKPFSWCDLQTFSQARDAINSEVDPLSHWSLGLEITEEEIDTIIGPAVLVEEVEGLGPMRCRFSVSPVLSGIFFIPDFYENSDGGYAWFVEYGGHKGPPLLRRAAGLPAAIRRSVIYVRGEGPVSLTRTTRWGFDEPVFRGVNADVLETQSILQDWGVSSLNVDIDWFNPPNSSWVVERATDDGSWVLWARYTDRSSTMRAAAVASSSGPRQRVLHEDTGRVMATFVRGRLSG